MERVEIYSWIYWRSNHRFPPAK